MVTSLAGLVRAAADAAPHEIGYVDDTASLTWEEAAEGVDRRARALAAAGVQRGDRVAMSLAKSVEAHLLVHAMLELGAVFVPVDPKAAAETVAGIHALAEVRLTIAERPVRRRWDRDPLTATLGSIEPAELLALAPEPDGAAGRTEPLAPGRPTRPDDPAYVIFTSGSTGRPKGILHTHGSAAAYVVAAAAAHRLTANDVVAGLAPLHFDMSTLELYVAPHVGATVAPVRDAALRFPQEIVDHSVRHSCTLWYLVPTLLRSVLDAGALDEPLPELRLVAYAGEALSPAYLRRFRELQTTCAVQNAYGPAETNVVSVLEVADEHLNGDAVPLGLPWAAASFEVLDEAGEVSDERGELWLSSPTLMSGYLGDDPRPEGRFRTGRDGRSWYRSGDVVEAGPYGWVFRGRVDHQVKVRGVRVELEGIEAAIERHEVVSAAVAAAVPAGGADRIVVAVGVDGLDRPAADLLEEVSSDVAAGLTGVARPADWYLLDEISEGDLPTTASGKLDRSRIRAALELRSGNVDERETTAP